MMEATNSHDNGWIPEGDEIVEQWTDAREQPDWAALEKSWAATNSGN
jgi:hypothetical protein